MYSHILIPTDGSEFAGKGVEKAVNLAKALGARVTIITVTEMLPIYMGADAIGWNASAAFADYDEHQDAAAREVLAAAERKAVAGGVEVDSIHVPRAKPADAIIETAKSRNCDLIVMASHGRRGVRRLILGSQTSEVLAQSPVPVLVVPPDARSA